MRSALQREFRFWLEDRLACSFKENARPIWLITEQGERCELDFLIEPIRLAIEIQGDQHYRYTPHFHGSYENFLAQQRRDEFKRIVCAAKGIKLFLIHDLDEFREVAAYLARWREVLTPQLSERALAQLKGTRFHNKWCGRVKAIEKHKRLRQASTDVNEIRKYDSWIQEGEKKLLILFEAHRVLIDRAVEATAPQKTVADAFRMAGIA